MLTTTPADYLIFLSSPLPTPKFAAHSVTPKSASHSATPLRATSTAPASYLCRSRPHPHHTWRRGELRLASQGLATSTTTKQPSHSHKVMKDTGKYVCAILAREDTAATTTTEHSHPQLHAHTYGNGEAKASRMCTVYVHHTRGREHFITVLYTRHE